MKWTVTLAFVIASNAAFSQQPVKNFTLTNVGDGASVSLNTLPGPVVVLFISNECAFDKYYTTRIQSLISAYSGKIQFLLINSNLDLTEAAEPMAARYKAWGLNQPYLADKEQLAMTALGAKKSPEAFLLQKSGDAYAIVYKGLIDDNPQVESDVRQQFLKDAIENVLAGRKVAVLEQRAIGCSIRRK